MQQDISADSLMPGIETSNKILPVGFYLCSIHLNSCCSQLWGAVEPSPALCTVCRPVLLQQTSHRLLENQEEKVPVQRHVESGGTFAHCEHPSPSRLYCCRTCIECKKKKKKEPTSAPPPTHLPFHQNQKLPQVETTRFSCFLPGLRGDACVDGQIEESSPPLQALRTLSYFKPSVWTDSPALERKIDSHLKKEMSNI